MENLRAKLLKFSRKNVTSITAKELKTMLKYIQNEAVEYYLDENVSDEYLATLLSDIREDML
jgi:hypothetical protein